MRDKRKLKVAKERFPVFGSNGGLFLSISYFFSKKVKKPEQLKVFFYISKCKTGPKFCTFSCFFSSKDRRESAFLFINGLTTRNL